MTLPLFQVDAFTAEAFRGNPAAVVLLDKVRPDLWMQSVATEMNLAETAFLLPSGGCWSLRWFTPTVEVDLCGHATLATAHVLWETGRLAGTDTVGFDTKIGRLGASRSGNTIELDFPATPAEAAPAEAAAVAKALGVAPQWVGRTRFDIFARFGSARDVIDFAPDFPAIGQLQARGVIITAPADDGRHDFVSRYFGPQSGINEDPVTGSAHCALGPYWGAELTRETVLGFQASQRGGTVRVILRGDRVGLAGNAVTILRGELVA